MKTDKKYASVFELNGMPKFSQAFPLALQHVVAMIVGCVTCDRDCRSGRIRRKR